jgi:hypothetical protein
MDFLPPQFQELREALESPLVASDAEITPERVAKLAASEIAVYVTAYKNRDEVVSWAAETRHRDIATRVERLTRVWEILGRDRIPTFDPEELLPDSQRKADWSTLPREFGYLVTAAEHWGNAKEGRIKSAVIPRRERAAFREVAQRIKRDRIAIDQWMRARPIDIARGRLSSLLILVEELEPDKADPNLVSPRKLRKLLRSLSEMRTTWTLPLDGLLESMGATVEESGDAEILTARTMDGVELLIYVDPHKIRQIEIPIWVFAGSIGGGKSGREVTRARTATEALLSQVAPMVRHIQGVYWRLGNSRAYLDMNVLPGRDGGVLSIRLVPLEDTA